MNTATATLATGQRIVWGSGELPGVYNGPAPTLGCLSVKLDIDRCSITVPAASVAPADDAL
ncbi:hypothetical protein [Streptomyces anulatus]|uniref:hypothetical protein n=1 Tax=Streptomyces anulatus TaxID=1892 RepID=UPI001C26D843|nr:hypothetical protein [Streptomyces anulatus]